MKKCSIKYVVKNEPSRFLAHFYPLSKQSDFIDTYCFCDTS